MNTKTMASFHLQMLFFIGLFTFLLITKAEDSSATEDVQSPTPPVVVADICNMSLITSIEGDVDTVQKKCTCNSANMDVDCKDLGITELPKLISFPKSVHVASFSGNKIANLNADTFYNGREITELDFSYNQIDFVSSKAFQAFKNLKRLDLSHNRVWNLPTSALHGINGLQRLDLSFNDLVKIFPELFASLTDLRELILESNPLKELEPKHFEHLQKLERLDLQATMLRVVPDHVFVFTPKLKYLNLAGNLLSEVPTDALRYLDRAKVLDLSGNLIEVIRPEAFVGLTGLVILYLDRLPHLQKIDKYAFGDMIHLQEFHCSYNFLLSEIHEHAFVRKVNSQRIQPDQVFLRQNKLKNIPKMLISWNEGMELDIRDNPLHCDCNVEWMVNTKLKNNFQGHAMCASPSELEHMVLSDLKNQELTCGLHLSEIIMIACGIVTALLICVLIVAFLVWRRSYAGYSKPYFHVPKNKHINNMDYHAGDDDI